MLRFAQLAAVAFAALWVAGCSSDQEKPPNTVPTNTAPSSTTTAPPADSTASTGGTGTGTPPATTGDPSGNTAGKWAGSYKSASCGDRKYERLLSLRDNGSFNGEDRVSPCPPGAQCIWSGIVMWQGRFEVTDTAVVLTRSDQPGGGPAGAAKIDNPLKLEIDKAAAQLVETRGGERCAYTRVTDSAPEKR